MARGTSGPWRLAAMLLLVWGACGAASGQVLSVRLKPQVHTAHSLVRIGDVADLSGGSDEGRRRIGELDLAELPARASQRAVTRRQVMLRILLAGFPAGEVSVGGAEQTIVAYGATPEPPAADLLERIRARVLKELSAQLDIAPGQLRVRFLHEPVLPNWPEEVLGETEVELHGDSRLNLGRTYPKVVLLAGDRISPPIPLAVDALAHETVAVAARPIGRQEPLGPDNVQVVERWVDQARPALGLERLEGKKASRPIAAGQIIGPEMIEASGGGQEAYLVDPRRPVRLIARRGALTVYLHNAEALQRGREGDYVRVRNPSSSKVLTGMVIGQDEVEIRF